MRINLTSKPCGKNYTLEPKNNDCLITVGTGTIQDEDAIGLVGSHALGILEVVEFRGQRMLLVKIPGAISDGKVSSATETVLGPLNLNKRLVMITSKKTKVFSGWTSIPL
jgi:hypothetical protein